jgi:hypothetical protein
VRAARATLTFLAGVGALGAIALALYCLYRYASLPHRSQHASPWDDLGVASAIVGVVLGAVTLLVGFDVDVSDDDGE